MEKSLPVNGAPRPTIQENYALQREAMKSQGYQEHHVRVPIVKLILIVFFAALILSILLFALYRYLHQDIAYIFPSRDNFLFNLTLSAIIATALIPFAMGLTLLRINKNAIRYFYLTSSWQLGPYFYYGESLTYRNYFLAQYAIAIIIGVIPFIMMLLFASPPIFILLSMLGFSYGIFTMLYARKLKQYRNALLLNVPGRLDVLAFTKQR
jgi:hypothetical protein